MSPNWIASTSARASGSSCDNLIPPAEELDTCSPDTAGGSSSVRRSTWREQISRARGPAYPEAHARRSKSSRMPATAVSRFGGDQCERQESGRVQRVRFADA